jgi:hypothetical protein
MKHSEKFAICVKNRDCEDLEKRNVYPVMEDSDAEMEGYFRIIDASGDDYLYPRSYFVLISLPIEAKQAMRISHGNMVSPKIPLRRTRQNRAAEPLPSAETHSTHRSLP